MALFDLAVPDAPLPAQIVFDSSFLLARVLLMTIHRQRWFKRSCVACVLILPRSRWLPARNTCLAGVLSRHPDGQSAASTADA